MTPNDHNRSGPGQSQESRIAPGKLAGSQALGPSYSAFSGSSGLELALWHRTLASQVRADPSAQCWTLNTILIILWLLESHLNLTTHLKRGAWGTHWKASVVRFLGPRRRVRRQDITGTKRRRNSMKTHPSTFPRQALILPLKSKLPLPSRSWAEKTQFD